MKRNRSMLAAVVVLGAAAAMAGCNRADDGSAEESAPSAPAAQATPAAQGASQSTSAAEVASDAYGFRRAAWSPRGERAREERWEERREHAREERREERREHAREERRERREERRERGWWGRFRHWSGW